MLSRFANDGVEADDHDDHTETSVPRLGGFEVLNRTIDIAQAALMRHTLAAYPPGPADRGAPHRRRSLEFHRADEVIEIGQELAAAALDTLAPRTSHA